MNEQLINSNGHMSAQDVTEQVTLIQQVMQAAMKKNEHYGVIPGTDKPTLLKPGAEKLCLTFRLGPDYDVFETYDGNHYTVRAKCTLVHTPTQNKMGAGDGLCSTKESKYAYRQAGRKCPQCQKEAIIKGKEEYGGGWLCYNKKGGCGAKFADEAPEIVEQEIGRVANDNLADCYNTILKMACKRALVAAVLNVTAASDIFTQDLDDLLPPDPPITTQPTGERKFESNGNAEKFNGFDENFIQKFGPHKGTAIKDLPEEELEKLGNGQSKLKEIALHVLSKKQSLSAGEQPPPLTDNDNPY